MDAKLKEQWIEELESGKYKKGKRYLRRHVDGEDTWCCLGVLCHMVDPDGWEEYDDCMGVYIHTDISFSYLPSRVRGRVEADGKPLNQAALSYLNDNSDSFDPVIAYIKEKL